MVEALFELVGELFTTAAMTADDKNPKGCFIFMGIALLIIIGLGLYFIYK